MKYALFCFVWKCSCLTVEQQKLQICFFSFGMPEGQSDMSRDRKSKRVSLMRRMTASVHGCALNQSLPVSASTTDLSKWLKRMKTGWGAREKRSVSSPAHLYWGVCNKQRQKYWLRSAVKQAALNIAQKTRRILCIQWFCCWNAAHIWAIKRKSKQHLKQQHKHRYQ